MQREKVVKRRLADGTVREYRYPVGGPKTVGKVIAEYKQASEFMRLAPGSKRQYVSGLEIIGESYHATPIVDIKRGHVKRHRDAYQDRPAVANNIVGMWSVLLKFALDMEYIEFNPAVGIERFACGEHRRWPDAAIEYALGKLRQPIARAIALALYTGQRESDVVKMRWSDIEAGGINVVQQKTGAKLWIPIHAALAALLEEWKKTATAVTILTMADGTPWRSAQRFARAFCEERDKHTALAGLRFHGLRKAAAAALAEAGCTTHEIASITGHASLKEVERYTREASQKKRATAAIVKLENDRKTGR